MLRLLINLLTRPPPVQSALTQPALTQPALTQPFLPLASFARSVAPGGKDQHCPCQTGDGGSTTSTPAALECHAGSGWPTCTCTCPCTCADVACIAPPPSGLRGDLCAFDPKVPRFGQHSLWVLAGRLGRLSCWVGRVRKRMLGSGCANACCMPTGDGARTETHSRMGGWPSDAPCPRRRGESVYCELFCAHAPARKRTAHLVIASRGGVVFVS